MRSAGVASGMAVLALGLGCGCGPVEAGNAGEGGTERLGERVAVQRQQIRPTDGTGWNNNGFGIPAQVYDPPGGHFRVYYVTSGENAVDLTDVAPPTASRTSSRRSALPPRKPTRAPSSLVAFVPRSMTAAIMIDRTSAAMAGSTSICAGPAKAAMATASPRLVPTAAMAKVRAAAPVTS